MFSIADMNSGERDVDYDENAPPEQEGESNEEDPELPSYPIRVSLSITKVIDSMTQCLLVTHLVKTTGPGALNVDTMCQEGAFVIDNASFYPDTQLGLELTADADWQRRGLYIGPRVRVPDASHWFKS